MDKYIKEVTVRKNGHKYFLYMAATGRIDCRIDNGDVFSVKELSDGKIHFYKPQEITLKGEFIKIDSVELDEPTFKEWREALDLILSKKEEKQILTFADAKVEALHYVDRWDRKVRSYKGGDKKRHKMCIHTFRIGNDTYTFVERSFPDKGIIINPDYAIGEGLSVGGVPKQYGELLFWDYYYEGEGWKRVRVLTNNEQICLSVVQKYGYFALPHKVDSRRDKLLKEKEGGKTQKPKKEKKEKAVPAEKPKKKGFFSFGKKKKSVEENEGAKE